MTPRRGTLAAARSYGVGIVRPGRCERGGEDAVAVATPADDAVGIELEKCPMQLAFRCNLVSSHTTSVICTGRTSVFAMISQIGAGLPASSDPDSWVRLSRPNVAQRCHPRGVDLPRGPVRMGVPGRNIGARSARRHGTPLAVRRQASLRMGPGPRCPVGEDMTRGREKCIPPPGEVHP